MATIRELDERYYPDFVDEHARFDRLVRRYLRPEDIVLDAGAGHGRAFAYGYRDVARSVVGVDAEPGVAGNANVSVACRGDLARLPFADRAFDLILAKYVFEHLTEPLVVLRELRRVLKPGGQVVFHTPNRRHYVAIAARLTPTSFHRWFKSRRRGGSPPDAHPTHYLANDPGTLQRLGAAAGFRVAQLELFEPKPTYLFFHPLAYRAGIAYERAVGRVEALAGLRANLIGSLEATGA